MSIAWPVSIAGALFAAWAIASARSTSKRTLPARTRWVLVARDASLALIGVGIAVVPWARPVGLGIGIIGMMGRLYFQILASLVRRANR
jgi:hypothetical protein